PRRSTRPARRIGNERWREVAEQRLGRNEWDRRSLFDRRYPPVPAVLAVCRCAASRTRDLPRPLRALRPHDGAAGGAEDAEGGGDGRLQFAGVRAPSHLRCTSLRPGIAELARTPR